MVSFFCKRIMCSFRRHWRVWVWGAEGSVQFIYSPILLLIPWLLFKTSPGVQISYCSIIINVEKKEAWFLPYESKPVFFRWMIIEPLGVAGNGPLSPLIQRNTNKHQLHINVKKETHTPISESKMAQMKATRGSLNTAVMQNELRNQRQQK